MMMIWIRMGMKEYPFPPFLLWNFIKFSLDKQNLIVKLMTLKQTITLINIESQINKIMDFLIFTLQLLVG